MGLALLAQTILRTQLTVDELQDGVGFGDLAGKVVSLVFFFQAEDGIRDLTVTGVQTCALPISLAHRRVFVSGFLAFVLASFLLVPMLGRNFFPAVDSGQILMHVRLQVGTRVEDSATVFAAIEQAIRRVIPPAELGTLVDNIGMPVSGINLSYNNTGTIGTHDGDVQIALQPVHRPTAEYVKTLREQLPARFPGDRKSVVEGKSVDLGGRRII